MTSIPQPDFSSRQFKANPFPFYARLRVEAPVFRIPLPGKQVGWLVTRYDDAVAVLKHPGLGKDRLGNMTPDQLAKLPWFMSFFKPLMHNMLDRDPPDHTRLRSLVHKAFTPRLVEHLRGRIQALTSDLLDAARRKGHMDLVTDYAQPVPATIIAKMLGVPSNDQHKFQRWSNKFVSNTSTLDILGALPAVLMFTRYIRKLIEQRRASPGDDLLTALIQAEESGDKLSQDELVSMVFLLLVAGHETTVNLIAGGALALLQHPEQRERLRQTPSLSNRRSRSSCATPARSSSPPSASHARTSPWRGRHPARRPGVRRHRLRNRDESHFQNPDTLDLSREPNKHLSFGLGIHYCLGAPLARLEGRIAIQNLLDQLPHLRLTKPAESIPWRTGFIMRANPRKLPVLL